MKKKKIFGIAALIVGILLVSALLAYGLLLLTARRNVAETGNVLGVTWYNTEDTEFTITTKKELYELASLSSFYTFADQTIKLGADIVVNEGNATDWEQDAPSEIWKPISNFAGVFDGQGHSISGIYGKTMTAPLALFTYTNKSCIIQDVKLVNSYFESRGASGTASFSANGDGNFIKLYSDAIINTQGDTVGGIIGAVDMQVNLDECWYDGSIRLTGRFSGGLVASILNGRVAIRHSLFSGTLVSEHTFDAARAGGIVGRVEKTAGLNMTDTLVTGNLTMANGGHSASVLGVAYTGAQVVFIDTYDGGTCNYVKSVGTGSVTGMPVKLSEKQLTGVKAYQWTTLDFENYWAAVDNDTPILKYFADQTLDLTGVEKEYDISWYDKTKYNFTLTTAKQLYGFWMLSNTNDFAGVTIKLGNDIVLNEGNAKDWTDASKAPENQWMSIGNTSFPFAGIFDGQGHSISGIYIEKSKEYNGLFGITAVGSVIKNLKVTNSLLNCVGQGEVYGIGSIAGECRGSLDTVYSNMIIITDGYQIGGLVGRLNYMDSSYMKPNVVNNCWYDGELVLKGTARRAGGIAGIVSKGSKIDKTKVVHTFSNCLNTAKISSERPDGNIDKKGGQYIGGIFGEGGDFVIDVIDCMNVGEIEVNFKVYVGSIFGRLIAKTATCNLTNTYATQESYKNASGVPSGYWATGNINGGVTFLPESMLTGYNGYAYTTLDFDTYWAVVSNDTPILKSFAGKTLSLANVKRKVDTSWYDADKDTYVLDSVEDLYGFWLLSLSNNFEGKTIKLGADIAVNPSDAATVEAWKKGSQTPENTWIAIGSSSLPFAGTFDGQGYTISGIYLKDTSTELTYSGLFGVTAVGSVIRNFRLVDSYFERIGQESHIAFLGSVVCEARGVVDSVYSNAVLVTDGQQVGGIVARLNYMDANYKDAIAVNNCWFDGEIIGAVKYTGGIVGITGRGSKIKETEKVIANITNCLNTGYLTNDRVDTSDGFGGQYIGGILGADGAAGIITIDSCINNGTLDFDFTVYVGAIIGRIKTADTVVTVSDSYTVQESYATGINGNVGTLNGGVIVVPETVLAGYNGYKYTLLDFDTYWAIGDETPVLKFFTDDIQTVNPSDKTIDFSWYEGQKSPYKIDSVADLYGLYQITTYDSFKGDTVLMTDDIHVNGADVTATTVNTWKNGTVPNNQWIAIGSTTLPFAGTFDGQGFTISGIYLKDTSTELTYSGLFGVTAVGSTISNFELRESYFERTGQTNHYGFLGSVVCEARGVVDSVYSNAIIVTDGQQVGGIVARLNYMDSNYADAIAVNNCWFDGEISGAVKYAGGIVGIVGRGSKITEMEKVVANIKNCLNTGYLTNDRVDTSDGFGGQYIGGILGADLAAARITIGNCLNNGDFDFDFTVYIGAIIGRNATADTVVTVSDTYTVRESYATGINGNAGTINGGVIVMPEVMLTGYNGYKYTVLNFTDYWAVGNETPILQSFADNVQSVNPTDRMVDFSWYEEQKSPYLVDSEEDLYGLAQIATYYNFKGDTVLLAANLKLNGDWAPSVDDAGTLQNTPENLWMPITEFDGTFTGLYNNQIHYISGVYVNERIQNVGLFGAVGGNGKIESLILKNSYINSSNEKVGGIVGYLEGNVDAVYVKSSVTVKGNGATGGIVGMHTGTGSGSISNSWFGGTAHSSSYYLGGIVGGLNNGTKTVSNCLFTGTVHSTTTRTCTGGIAGGGMAGTTVILLENCVSTGTIKTDAYVSMVGSVFGTMNYAKDAGVVYELTMKNVYTTDKRVYTGGTMAFNTTGATDGTGSNTTNKTNIGVKGMATILTADELKGATGYANTDLDFYSTSNTDGIWVATDIGPELKMFSSDTTAQTTFNAQRSNIDWYREQYTNATSGTMALPSAVTFEIDSAGDMNGFSAVANGTTGKTVAGVELEADNFSGDTVRLTKDINLNLGWTPSVDDAGRLQNAPSNQWIPIGKNGEDLTQFNGTFDGQYHVISGVYVNATTRDAGLFGMTNTNAEIRNLQLSNSYIGNSAYDCTGVIAGSFRGTDVENIYIDDSVTVYGKNAVGGVSGMLSPVNTRTINKCWFDGAIYASGVQVGGIIGSAWRGTNSIENCLFSGEITCTFAGKLYAGGIIGQISNRADQYTYVTDCVNIGTVEVNDTRLVSSVIGEFVNGSLKDVYTTNDITHLTDSSAEFSVTSGADVISKEELKTDAETILEDLFIKDNGVQNTAWELGTDGLPKLKWNVDGTLRVLLIGNSFSYYHTDELYGMLEAEGIEATVSNLYASGRTVSGHWTALNNNNKDYTFITVSEDGKTSLSAYSMVDCLEAAEWDIISLQQHFDPSDAMTYDKAASTTLQYTADLFAYLKENYPEARLLWQQTWAYQVGYQGVGGNYDSDENRRVDNVEKQTLNYENIRDVAIEVCETNGVERVPNGDAWQLARANSVVGDTLCNKFGEDLAADTTESDNYHDGDKGGGQFLNALGWYEVITGNSCLENDYVPSKYTLSNEVIQALKAAAHKAVEDTREMEATNAAKATALKNAISGKKVSIIGDSISTYINYSNNRAYNTTIGNNLVYYNGLNYVWNVNETWWMQTINNTGTELHVNNSWAGDCVTTNGVARATELDNNRNVAPDIILVYFGVNDFNAGVTTEVFREGYKAMILAMQNKYPSADIFVGTLFNSSTNAQLVEYNEVIKSIASECQCEVVDLYNESGINATTKSSLMGDGRLHPNNAGMDAMTKCYLAAMYKKYVK